MERTYWLCEDCLSAGIVRSATVADHVIPLSRNGLDIDENTRNLCDDCHRIRTAEQFGHKLKQAMGMDGWPK